jgi:DNA-binding MarR family transcriptional regulator
MSNQLKERLLRYLDVFSEDPHDLSSEPASKLPLFLREQYAIYSTRLFGRKTLLAIETEAPEDTSPGEYRKHADILRQNLGEPVVLVLSILPSHARNRMVQMHIPFVVPGSQAFLPGNVIDLRETFPQPSPKRRETLSPAAQCTVLYHLLRNRLDLIPLKDIAGKLRYSPMRMTKVKDELEAADICEITRHGRSLVLDFTATGRALWEQAKPRLTSPVRKTRWVQWSKPDYPALLAGISALSKRTMIADDRLPTYALSHPLFQDFLEKGICIGARDAEQATVKIEVWSYDPKLLGDDCMVDPLSLYLSLLYSPDERVHQQIEQLIQEVPW